MTTGDRPLTAEEARDGLHDLIFEASVTSRTTGTLPADLRRRIDNAIAAIEAAARSVPPDEGLREALAAVLEASHGPKLGSGATYRRCNCATHENAYRLAALASRESR